MDDMVVGRFEEKWRNNAGKVVHVAQKEELSTVLRDLAETSHASEQHPVVVSVGSEEWGQWVRTGDTNLVYIWTEDENPEEFRQLCARASMGVSACVWAAADVGSIGLYRQKDNSLLPSLLPPIHVVIVPVSHIVPNFRAGMSKLYQDAQDTGIWPGLVKIVAGPSMTADIEGQLILGVHGPRDVYAVILHE